MRNSDDRPATGGSPLAREEEVAAMISKTTTTAPGSITDPLDAAAAHLYDAECALHVAHQTHDDAWISAACQALHRALGEYLAVVQVRPRRAGP
jgi:hypothetical protein